jgi:hypothetical protein
MPRAAIVAARIGALRSQKLLEQLRCAQRQLDTSRALRVAALELEDMVFDLVPPEELRARRVLDALVEGDELLHPAPTNLFEVGL